MCRASYEYAVVRSLNQKRVDYEWQIRFQLTEDMVYFVDLYLPGEDKYIEIKGFFHSPRNQEKWGLFHSQYKNSAIWFGDKVSQVTGKSLYRIRKEFKAALAEQNDVSDGSIMAGIRWDQQKCGNDVENAK
jgi:hypothetical protein